LAKPKWTPVFDLLEIGITWAKPGTKKNAQFFLLD